MKRHGVTRQTFYRWRKKYGGLQTSDAKRLRALEEEKARIAEAAGLIPSAAVA